MAGVRFTICLNSREKIASSVIGVVATTVAVRVPVDRDELVRVVALRRDCLARPDAHLARARGDLGALRRT